MVPDKTKHQFLKELERTALIAAACRAVGISRATIYRWRKEDPGFVEKMDDALELGRGDWSDLAESKLISAVKRNEGWAIRYVLQYNNPRYYTPRSPKPAPYVEREFKTFTFQIVNTDGSYTDESGEFHEPFIQPMNPGDLEEDYPPTKPKPTRQVYRLSPPPKSGQ